MDIIEVRSQHKPRLIGPLSYGLSVDVLGASAVRLAGVMAPYWKNDFLLESSRSCTAASTYTQL